ncbi:hypothetical protein C1646_672818 [Rhizophagus diaphanus]|nr:hypothetical protein C1646_672818 [Rhizophagus diaphanus] [Rhizophagus sp. MUCL 43196]
MNVNHEIIDSSSEENKPINECFDSSDEENDFHYMIITGVKFHAWEELEVYLERYALQEGFSIKKTRVKYHLHQEEMKGLTADQKKLHVKRRIYECIHSSNHVSKKIINLNNQRNRGNFQVNYPWHINAAKPKKENTIGITSVKLEHNHIMNPLIAEMAPKFRKFTPEMITDVEFYVKHGINEICKEFLTPHILSAIQNQMKHSFFYDAYLVDKDTIHQQCSFGPFGCEILVLDNMFLRICGLLDSLDMRFEPRRTPV